jgi:hypothetical protein
MDLNQEPLPSPSFPRPSQPPPPEKPPDIFTFPSGDFQENEYVVPHGENPEDFLERNETRMRDAACEFKNDIIDSLRGPLQFQTGSSIETWHGFERLGINKKQFMIAFNLVITALDTGYHATRKTSLLGAQDWSTLLSAALAAIGRGYARTHSQYNKDYLGHIRRTTRDPSTNRSDPPFGFGNMFDRLTATAEHLHTYLAPDNEEAMGWINDLKEKTQFFTTNYATEVMAEALDKWKVYQIRERSNDLEEHIWCAVAEASKGCLMDAAAQMGLSLEEDPLCTPCRNPSHAAKRTPTESSAHRGQKLRQPSQNPSETDTTTTLPCQTAQGPEPVLTDIAAVIRVVISPIVGRPLILYHHHVQYSHAQRNPSHTTTSGLDTAISHKCSSESHCL